MVTIERRAHRLHLLNPGRVQEPGGLDRDAGEAVAAVRADGTGLILHLTYGPEAAEAVRDLGRKEQTCCAFLRFEMREDATGVHLSVTAPERARDAADLLFAHFAARGGEALPRPPRPSEKEVRMTISRRGALSGIVLSILAIALPRACRGAGSLTMPRAFQAAQEAGRPVIVHVPSPGARRARRRSPSCPN